MNRAKLQRWTHRTVLTRVRSRHYHLHVCFGAAFGKKTKSHPCPPFFSLFLWSWLLCGNLSDPCRFLCLRSCTWGFFSLLLVGGIEAQNILVTWKGKGVPKLIWLKLLASWESRVISHQLSLRPLSFHSYKPAVFQKSLSLYSKDTCS